MNNKKKLFLSYIKANIAPVLVDFISGEDLEDAIILPVDINVKELNGHYNGIDFVPPKWFSKILNTGNSRILVIDKIDSISKEEQTKFIELLKYRKISTFKLPKNVIVIVTASDINKNTINEEIFSLVAQI